MTCRYDHSLQAYLPYDRQWIKQKTLQHLKRLASHWLLFWTLVSVYHIVKFPVGFYEEKSRELEGQSVRISYDGNTMYNMLLFPEIQILSAKFQVETNCCRNSTLYWPCNLNRGCIICISSVNCTSILNVIVILWNFLYFSATYSGYIYKFIYDKWVWFLVNIVYTWSNRWAWASLGWT